MADDDLSVSFSGDASSLTAATAAARSALASFAPQATAAAKDSLDDLSASTSAVAEASMALLNVMRDIAVTAAAVTYVVKETGSAWETMAAATLRAEGAATSFAASAVGGGLSAIRTAITEAGDGFVSYASSVGYAQRGAAMFVVENDGLVAAMARGVVAVTEHIHVIDNFTASISDAWNRLRIYNSGIAETEMASISAAGNLKQFENALSAAGGVQADAEIGLLVGQLEKIPSTSDAAAQSIVTALTAIPSYTLASTQTMVDFLSTFTKTGAEAQAMAEKIRDAFKDQTNGGETLGNIAGQIKNMDALVTVTRQWAAALTPGQATSFLQMVESQLQRQKDLLQATADEQRKNLEAVNEIHRMNGEVEIDVNQQDAALTKQLSTLQTMITVLENHKQAYIGITAEMAKQKAYADAIEASTGPSAKLEDNAEKQKVLAQGGGHKGDDFDADSISSPQKTLALQTAMLEAGNQGLEGLTAFFNVLKNRLNANYGNYGDDLDSVLKKKRAFSGIDDSSGNFDASKVAGVTPSATARQAYDNTFGANPVDDPTKGATNYYRADQSNPAWAAGMTNVNKIGDHTFGNADGNPVSSDSDNEKAKESLEQLLTEQRALNAEKEGGTAIDKLTADQATANLTVARDEVKQAQDRLAALQKIAAAAKDGTPQEQSKDASAVTAASQAVLDKQREQQQAAMQLEIAQAQEGSKEREQLEINLANFKANQYAAGTKQAEDAAKEIADIEKKYNEQRAADATETENATFETYKKGIAARQQLVRDQQSTGSISGSTMLAQQQAILDEELAREKAHYAALEQINAAKPAMVRRYELQASEAIATITAQSAKDIEARNKEIEQSYRQHFEQVGSVVSSDLMGMLEGTKKFSDMFKDIAKNIVSQMLSAGVKMAADWAANQALMLVKSLGFYAADTAGASASEAAKTGVAASGAAAQAGVKATSMISSIMSSAQEAFAGVFGFLSPVLGPAAGVPAAAAQATVAAKAALPSFDVGAWSLPSNMVAQVHQGEMIVPAGPAALMRAAAGGASSGGGGGGGTTHNWNITAWDGASVKSWLNNGGARTIAQAVGAHQALNPSTR